jgi:hypothetical protein
MRWVGHVVRIAKKRNAYRILVGEPEGKGLLGTPIREWIILKWIRDGIEMGWYGMN